MAADTTEGQSEQSEQKDVVLTEVGEVAEAPVEVEELGRWVFDTLLRGEDPEQVAHFVAQLRLKDEAYEALELHLQESILPRQRFPTLAGAKEQQAFFEFGKPPPLPREMPLQRLRRNLSELDAIMARLVADSPPSPVPGTVSLGQTGGSRSRAPVAVVGCANPQERLAPPPGRSLLLPCVHGSMMPRPSDPRLSQLAQPPPGCLASVGRSSEDVVGQQVNDFIKARWGTCPMNGVSHLAAPRVSAVAPSGSVCRTVSPIRQCGQHPHPGLYQVNGASPTPWPQQCIRTCGKQVPFGMLVPTLVTRPSRGRSAEPAPRGRTHCTAPEPRTMANQPMPCPCGPSGPSRALSATMLTRSGGQVLVVTGPALPVRTVRQPSPVRS